ncbi:MAG: DUF4124 domain-containing protein [Pseudomonadota bacterium]|nr:DUF4124 domain-containing protein [Pseudomonadota bacterium]
MTLIRWHNLLPIPGLIMALFWLIWTPLGHGEIYRWQDERGRVHYGDEPPAGVTTTRMQPDSGRQGVQLSDPDTARDWAEAALATEPRSSSEPSQPSQAARARAEHWQQDLCEGVVGDCFTEQQDYVCYLRYGLDCRRVYHWKVCLQQDCQDQRIADQCESPFHLLDRRPAVIGERDLGRPLPLQELVSESDWQCLQRHGFFCDEVAVESRCQALYGQPCSVLKNWVSQARMRCQQQRGTDCDQVTGWKQFRPVTLAQREKAGARLPGGGVATRDHLLEALGVAQDDPEQYPALWQTLEALTGLNIRERRRRFDCDGVWARFRPYY